MFYVAVPRINGRINYVLFADHHRDRFVGEMEYNEGGWQDKHPSTVIPHMRFSHAEDATAFALTHGGVVSKEIPCTRGQVVRHNWNI